MQGFSRSATIIGPTPHFRPAKPSNSSANGLLSSVIWRQVGSDRPDPNLFLSKYRKTMPSQ